MADNTDNETAAQASPPQNADGAAQSGEDTPVFVENSGEFLRHISIWGGGTTRPMEHRYYLWSFGFAMLYALVFTIAEGLFPQLYRAWLDFCLPLAEYVSGLTPRADRIAGQLVENGYAERADDAIHGIAMARVLMIPVLIFMMAAVWSAARLPPPLVSCTRRTHTITWLRLIGGMLVFPAVGAACVYSAELVIGEDFHREHLRIKSYFDFHRSNFGIVGEVIGLFCIFAVFALGAMVYAMRKSARYTIVEQPPEDKS